VRSAPDSLQTERLVLRRWRASDHVPFARLNGDPHVMRFFARTRTAEESRAEAERFDAAFDWEGFGFWAVAAPGVADFIGFVGCFPVNPALAFAPGVEAGWRLDRPFWGRGYAPEAARAALADVFGRCEIPEIVADAAVRNRPSQRVMERLGMRRDPAEDFDHPLVPEGHPMRRHVLYRLSAEDFSA
jgi:RimJ/RimL family protein N-acetyltransferase